MESRRYASPEVALCQPDGVTLMTCQYKLDKLMATCSKTPAGPFNARSEGTPSVWSEFRMLYVPRDGSIEGDGRSLAIL